jgi:hypothetical protein
MYWSDIDDGAWEGLTVTLDRHDLPAHPQWTTDIVRPGRVRITAGGAARWWARQSRDWASLALLRGAPMTRDDAVLRPITSDDLRAVTAAPGTMAWWRYWSLWFVEAMVASGRSPLRPGLWWIAPVLCRDVASLAVLDRVRRRATLTARWDAAHTTIENALGPAWTEDRWDEWWYNGGSGGLLPLRRASPRDSGRLKSWRKRAREGTLPPVLVHFIGALDMFVLLDGHDRYAAAVAEGVPVPWLHVAGLTLTPVRLDLVKQAAIVREVERLVTVVPPVPTASINALYAGAFDDRPWPSRVCYGRLLAGGAPQWDLEVTRRLAELGLSDRGAAFFE